MKYEETLRVNRMRHPVEIEPGRSPLSVLRDHPGLTNAPLVAAVRAAAAQMAPESVVAG